MIRVVIDTNVVVSAALTRAGLPAAVMDLVADGQIVACFSPAILEEYREVLSRARIGIDLAQAELLLELLSSVGVLVHPVAALNITPDPDDDMFIECAEEAGADFLITGNSRHFPHQYKTTEILTPRAFMEAWQKLQP